MKKQFLISLFYLVIYHSVAFAAAKTENTKNFPSIKSECRNEFLLNPSQPLTFIAIENDDYNDNNINLKFHSQTQGVSKSSYQFVKFISRNSLLCTLGEQQLFIRNRVLRL